MDKLKTAWKYIFNGHFIVSLVRWLVLTGGNIGESAFLLATLWVTLNAVAHVMLTWFLSNHIIELFNYLSLVAFSLLPELIIIPLIATCYSHWDVVAKENKRKDALVWALLYTIPAIVFLVMTIFTVSQFVNTGGSIFTPATGWQLVTRALFGWMFSAVNMLFAELGKPHYASKLADKNAEIDRLDDQIESIEIAYVEKLKQQSFLFKTELDAKQNELETTLNELQKQKGTVAKLSERASSLVSQDLGNYPKVISTLVDTGIKTVSVEDLSELTGLSKRKIGNAKLLRHSRNKDLIMVSSAVEWLRKTPPCSVRREDETLSNIVSISEYIELEA